jgi:hypothetical protein
MNDCSFISVNSQGGMPLGLLGGDTNFDTSILAMKIL